MSQTHNMTLFSVAALILIASISSGERVADPDFRLMNTGINRIIGGTEAQEGEIPWQVSVQSIFGFHFCGGSIIGPNHIVTAGHCSEYPLEVYRILAGSVDQRLPGTYHNVVKIRTHPSYVSLTLENDISVWEIEPPFVWNSKVQPIQIPAPTAEVQAGSIFTVSGWGYTDSSAGTTPLTLQKVQVPIVDKYECNLIYDYLGGIFKYNICAGQDGKDSCNGDSGGPLFDKNVLFGLVSWGPNFGCGLADFPGVYTEVAGYSTWISQIVNATKGCKAVY